MNHEIGKIGRFLRVSSWMTSFACVGLPGTIVSDNGTGFTLMAILRWRQETGVARYYIVSGRPRRRMRPSSSRATRKPESEVSGTSARHSRV